MLKPDFTEEEIEQLYRLFMEHPSAAYAPGDKVIQRFNNYDKEVFNGNIGVISAIDMEESLLQITFEERIVDYEFNELDEIDLAYATSIHKAQGSEYPVVVIPMAMLHFMLLERNLLYTGVTEANSSWSSLPNQKPWLWRLKISDLNAGWLI